MLGKKKKISDCNPLLWPLTTWSIQIGLFRKPTSKRTTKSPNNKKPIFTRLWREVPGNPKKELLHFLRVHHVAALPCSNFQSTRRHTNIWIIFFLTDLSIKIYNQLVPPVCAQSYNFNEFSLANKPLFWLRYDCLKLKPLNFSNELYDRNSSLKRLFLSYLADHLIRKLD